MKPCDSSNKTGNQVEGVEPDTTDWVMGSWAREKSAEPNCRGQLTITNDFSRRSIGMPWSAVSKAALASKGASRIIWPPSTGAKEIIRVRMDSVK